MRAAFFPLANAMSLDLTSDRRVARQSLWMGAITGVQFLGGLVQVSLSARILGPEGFGVLAVIMAITALIHGLLSMPGGDTVTTFATRAVAEGRAEEASRILRFSLVASFGLSLVAYALIAGLALAGSGLLGIAQVHADAVLLFGVVGILRATQSGTMAVLRLADRVSLGLIVIIATMLTRVALLIITWLTDGGLIEIVMAYVAGGLVNGMGMFAVATMSVRRAGMTDLLCSFSLKVPPDVVRFHMGIFSRTSLWALAENLDVILLAQLASATDVGLYRAARQIIDTARRPFEPLRQSTQPEFSRQWYSRQGAALRRTVLRFTLLAIAFAVVGFGLLGAFRESITQLILGTEFSGAAPLLSIMIPGTFVATSFSVLGVLPVATGRFWPLLASTTAGLVASVVAIVWLVPLYGAAGAAWANTTYFLVEVIVLTPFTVSILRRSYQLS